MIFCYMLCTIFLAEEMSVRKTVTAWSPKRSRNAIVTGEQEFMNGSSKVSGFLLRARPDLTMHYRVTSRSSHYQAGCGRPALEQIEGRDFRKPLRLTAGSGPRSQTASNDLEEGDSASTTLGTAFPHRVFLPSSVRKP